MKMVRKRKRVDPKSRRQREQEEFKMAVVLMENPAKAKLGIERFRERLTGAQVKSGSPKKNVKRNSPKKK